MLPRSYTPSLCILSMTSLAASRAISARMRSPGGRTETDRSTARPLTAGSESRTSSTLSVSSDGVEIRSCSTTESCRTGHMSRVSIRRPDTSGRGTHHPDYAALCARTDERSIASSGTAGRQASRSAVAYLQRVDEREHVGPFVCCRWLVVLGQHVGHLLQGEAAFVRVDAFSDQGDVLTRESVIQAEGEAVQYASKLFVGGA